MQSYDTKSEYLKRKSSTFPHEDSILYDIIMHALQKNLIFSSFPQGTLDKLIDRMRIRQYRHGDNIILEGSKSESIFIVLKGSVNIYSESFETVLSSQSEGAFFGEIGVLFDIPRTVSVNAATHCLVAYILKGDLTVIFEEHKGFQTELRNKAKEHMHSFQNISNSVLEKRGDEKDDGGVGLNSFHSSGPFNPKDQNIWSYNPSYLLNFSTILSRDAVNNSFKNLIDQKNSCTLARRKNSTLSMVITTPNGPLQEELVRSTETAAAIQISNERKYARSRPH